MENEAFKNFIKSLPIPEDPYVQITTVIIMGIIAIIAIFVLTHIGDWKKFYKRKEEENYQRIINYQENELPPFERREF